ncbi:hypothetical protein ACROYT_G002118 [Oculina patagonica]
MQTAQYPPITDIKIVSQRERCPAGYFMLTKTVQGYDGQMFDSTWRHKGKRFLCFTREVGETVIEDLAVIGEDDSVLAGFTAITKAHDDDDKALRKHFLCLKIQSSKTAVNAVCDIVLINRTKGEQTPPGYHLIANEVNNLSVCFKTAPVSRQQPGPPAGQQYAYSNAPHSLGPNRQQWYGQPPAQQGPWQQQPGYQAPPPTLPKVGASSAIEGLPFEVNSKFDILWKKSGPAIPNMQSLSVSDINTKYDYDFSKERAVTSR